MRKYFLSLAHPVTYHIFTLLYISNHSLNQLDLPFVAPGQTGSISSGSKKKRNSFYCQLINNYCRQIRVIFINDRTIILLDMPFKLRKINDHVYKLKC